MAAGIEARFPFLDSSLVTVAVNLPYRYKVRFSPLTRVRKHLYLRDKWIIRKIADRYLPRHLSQRMKMGFPAQAYYRMNISPDFFRNSHVSQILELTPDQMRHLYEHSDQKMKVRLLHLDVWAHVCLYNLPDGETIARMKDNITFNSQ
jgi:asparagine synthase (glutamine-hydrolysing)